MTTSAIEWTDRVWNPTTGCTQISPGCAHCYAKTFAARLQAMGQPKYQNNGGKGSGPGFKLTLHPDVLQEPLHWTKPSRIFVDSMSDLFHEDVPFEFLDRVFAVMALTPQHTYQVLTKRPERMRRYFESGLGHTYYNGLLNEWRTLPEKDRRDLVQEATLTITRGEIRGDEYNWPEWPLPNVWLGVTVENQLWADKRIPVLLDTPAAVRFISAEPLLGPVRLPCACCFETELELVTCSDPEGAPLCESCALHVSGPYKINYLDWVIVGGESGPRHRPFDPDWARSIVAHCRDAGVACFVKQLGGARPGNKLEDLPEDLRVREFPR